MKKKATKLWAGIPVLTLLSLMLMFLPPLQVSANSTTFHSLETVLEEDCTDDYTHETASTEALNEEWKNKYLHLINNATTFDNHTFWNFDDDDDSGSNSGDSGDNDDSGGVSIDCCDQGGDKPRALTMRYVGGNCSNSNDSQDDKSECDNFNGGLGSPASVFIIVSKEDDGGDTYFSGTVGLNSTFTPDAGNAGDDDFPSKIFFRIFSSQGGSLLQINEIHTSCSAPLVLGEQFGGLVLEDITFKNGFSCTPPEICPKPIINVPTGQICAGDPVTFSAPDLGFPCLEYMWSFGATATPSTATGRGPHTVTFMNDGTATVLLTIDNGCEEIPCDEEGGSGTGSSDSSGSSGGDATNSSGTSGSSGSSPCNTTNGSSGSGSGSGGSDSGGSGSNSGGSGSVGIGVICPGPGGGSSDSGNGGNSSGGSASDGTGGGGSGSGGGGSSSGGTASDSGIDSSGDGGSNSGGVCMPCRKTTTITIQVEDCQPNLGSIGDRVFNDLDEDGIQDGNEPGVPNVTVQLKDCANNVLQTTTTNGAGFYNFGSLNAGCYRIGILLPNGFSVSPQNQGGDDTADSDISPNTLMTGNINLGQGENDPTNDAGIFQDDVPNPGSIGDRVFNDQDQDGVQDPGEPGVSGVTVQLKDCANNILQTTTTDGNGNYNFGNLDAGCYRIGIELPNGFSVSPQNQGGDDTADSDISPNTLMTGNINLDPGEDDPTNDAGIFQDGGGDPCTALQVTVTPGKIAINGLDGSPIAIAKIFDPNFNLVFQCVAADCNAMEMVSGLDPGEYCVDVQFYTAQWSPICRFDDCFDVPPGGGGDDGTIGDRVFNDLDEDGIQDPGEPGVPNVTVQLKDCSNTVLQTTTTNGSGNYSFDNLAAGCYRIGILLPSGFSVSPQNQGGNDGADSDISPNTLMTGNINLADGENDPTNDAGIFQDDVPNNGSIGDRVFNDENQNGQQNATEPGVPNVTVQLKDCANNVLQTTTTNAAGFYSFDNLPAGCYRIGIVLPNGFSVSPQDVGSDDTDSDINPSTLMTGNVNLDPGEDIITVDAGIFDDNVPNLGNIGDNVFRDEDGDGIKDPGEPGVPGVTVQLKDCSNNVLQTTTTDASGNYNFGSLQAGCYRIGIVLPNGFSVSPQNQGGDDTVDSDISPSTLMTGNINLDPGENDFTNDAGLVPDDPGDPCDAIDISVSSGKITVSGANAPIVLIKVFDSNWQTVFECGSGGNQCSNPQMIPNLDPGRYCVNIKLFTAQWQTICTLDECVDVPNGGDPCDGLGGDNDNDGVCADQDCDDNNPNIGAQQTPGTSCNDGNPNTINDVIQSDGCTCAGTPIGDPCDGQGGDNDNDGVCADQDCDDNNPNIGAQQTPGTACNDGNPNTTNDVIQADGCTCAGTPGGGDPDCDDVSITTGDGSITVSGLNAPIVIVKVFNANWNTVFECSNNCGVTEVINNLPDGDYCVQIKFFTSSWSVICERLECVFVGGGGGCNNLNDGGTIGFSPNCSSSLNLGTCPQNPPLIQNCETPSGGTGTIEYIWLISTTSDQLPTTTIEDIVNDPHWSIIPGATSANHDPGSINTTTYYLRCSRREGCTRYLGESNIIAAICTGGGSNITLSCPNNITVTQNHPNGAIVNWSNPTASTTCSQGGASVSQTTGPANGSMFPVGSTVVAYQATDPCGGSATCSFTVTVNPDGGGGDPPTGYCDSSGDSPWVEWIRNVQFGNINNMSAKEGYGDFTHIGTDVNKGQSYSISIEPKFSWTVYTEHFRVWIDFNRDGDFEDAGEKVLEAQSSSTVVGSITIPNTAESGATRMRISMRRDGYAGPCMQFAQGEVEDYTISINNTFSPNDEDVSRLSFFPNPAEDEVHFDLSDLLEEEVEIIFMDAMGRVALREQIVATDALQTVQLSTLVDGLYTVIVQANDKHKVTRLVVKR